MGNFNISFGQAQADWRQKHIANTEHGRQNRVSRPWILPEALWEEGVWRGIRSDLLAYIAGTAAPGHDNQQKKTAVQIERHTGAHNLKRSWIACANLYFPFRRDSGRPLLAAFLKDRVSPAIREVVGLELEYAEESPLDPQSLLGESS